MNFDQAKKTIEEIFRKVAPEIDFSEIDYSANFRDQVEIDSYDFYKVIVKIYETTGANISDEELRRTSNLNDLIALVAQRAK